MRRIQDIHSRENVALKKVKQHMHTSEYFSFRDLFVDSSKTKCNLASIEERLLECCISILLFQKACNKIIIK